MVIKVYVSGICGSQDMRKKQQRVLFILESLKVDHEVVDITEPGKEDVKTYMREECSKKGKNNALPPQIFVDEHYLGDYGDFEIATENDNLMTFLQLPERKFSRDRNGAEEILEESENKGGLNLINGFGDLTNGHIENGKEQLNDEEENANEGDESEEKVADTEDAIEENEPEETNKAESEEEEEEEGEEEENDE